MPPASLSISEERAGDQVVLRLSGELDLDTAPELEGRLSELVSTDLKTVIDLSELSFVDSSGLALLVAGSKLAAENRGSLWVRDPSQPVSRLIEICGLTALLERPENHRELT